MKENIKKHLSLLCHLIKYPFSKPSRRFIAEYRRVSKVKLIMTFLIKNEEEIIEKNIRFHHKMGADGFIVASHNSTDKTNEILEKLKDEGLVLEIIHKTTPVYEQSRWVDEMIKIAKNKYKATWVINADADEFYYSKSLNLKKSIADVPCANVLWVPSFMLYPDNREDFLNCPYFSTRKITQYEIETLDFPENFNPYGEIANPGCVKVIHKTNGYKSIYDGNHDVLMKNRVKIQSADINLYHYHIKNYKGHEGKVLRWLDAAHTIEEGGGVHVKNMIERYKQGKLKEDYEKLYNPETLDFLIQNGIVTIDPSVSNFLKSINV